MKATDDHGWKIFQLGVAELQSRITKKQTVNINSKELRSAAQELVQNYFRQVRSPLAGLAVDADILKTLDAHLQSILRLSHGPNARGSYIREFKAIRRLIPQIDGQRLARLGTSAPDGIQSEIFDSTLERSIFQTLEKLIPSAALSYEQALRDLREQRLSYRGTAGDLREVLRETLDHFAPDADVRSALDIKKDEKLTMKQKVRFVLRSRETGDTARGTAEGATDVLEELTGGLARSVYNRGSVAAHVQSTRGEVMRIRQHLNSILAELLELYES